jgi:diadenosine tetraphosphate (Ap4A) HIT family hydrolase
MPSKEDEILLFENEDFEVFTPRNPHTSQKEGSHVVVRPKADVATPWEDPELCGKAFEFSARVTQIMKNLGLAEWFNLQANGNWGLLPGKTPLFHVHIYGRRKEGETWAMPVQLPSMPGTFNNDPMPEGVQQILSQALLKEF